MFINMVLALVVLPLLVWLIKPRFVERKDLLIGEGVDLSQFTAADNRDCGHPEFAGARSEEHTSELQSLMRISYAVFCLKKKITNTFCNSIEANTNESNQI